MILTTCLRSDDATTRKPFCLQPLSLYACPLKKLRYEEHLCSLVLRAMLSITLHIEDFVGLKTLSVWKQLQDCCFHSRRDLQSRTKSPWDSNAIFLFFCHSGFPHKAVHPFRNFLAVLPPSPYTKLKLGKKFWIHVRVQHCLWSEGRIWVCLNWKTPRNAKVSQDFCP